MGRSSGFGRRGRGLGVAVVEGMEGRRLFAGVSNVSVDPGLYSPGREIGVGAWLDRPAGEESVPVSFALSKDGVGGNGDDVALGSAETEMLPWMMVPVASLTATVPTSLEPGEYRVVARAGDGAWHVGPEISVQALPAGKDLQVEFAGMYAWLPPEWPASLAATVRNVGTEATGPWMAAVYLSKDRVLGSDDRLVAMADRGGSIAGGETVSTSIQFDPALGRVPDGVWYPIVVLDVQDQVAELDETNNVMVANPITVGPTVATRGVREIVLTSSRVEPGGVLGVDVRVEGPHLGSVGTDVVLELLGEDGVAYELPGVLTVPGQDTLPADQAVTVHADLQVPTGVPVGVYRLRMVVEIEGKRYAVQVKEGDIAWMGSQAIGPKVGVGMDIPADVTPLAMAAGSEGVVPLVVSNGTKKAVRREYNVTFFLSDDEKLSKGDAAFSRQRIAANIRAGGKAALRAAYQLPKGARLGTQYLIAVADPVGGGAAAGKRAARAAGGPAGRVKAVIPLEIGGARLEGTVRSVKSSGAAGSVVRVRVENTGSVAFAGVMTVKVVDEEGEVLGTVRRRVTVAAGDEVDVKVKVRGGVKAGSKLAVTLE